MASRNCESYIGRALLVREAVLVGLKEGGSGYRRKGIIANISYSIPNIGHNGRQVPLSQPANRCLSGLKTTQEI